MSADNWDDLRYILALARHGSAQAAARALNVNQTTVLRRLDALEAAVGVPLVDRNRAGHKLTETGRAAAEAAERMEEEYQSFRSALAAEKRLLAGLVRITASETLANRIVSPCLGAFRELHPDIAVELITSDARLDIARGEADVALRAGSRPEGAGIVARRLPDNDWTIYCSREYAARRGVPQDRAAIAGHDIIGMEGPMAALAGSVWLAQSAPDAVIRVRSNSMVNLVSNLKAGLGLGALPTLIGDSVPELVRCLSPPPELRSEMWIVVQEQQKSRPHVRAFTDFLARHVRREVSALAR